MANNIMDKLKDKLYLSKSNRGTFMRNLSGSQCLLNSSTRTYASFPTDFQKSCFSSVDTYEQFSTKSEASKMGINNFDIYSKRIHGAPKPYFPPSSESFYGSNSSTYNFFNILRSSYQQCAKSLEPFLGIFNPLSHHSISHVDQSSEDSIALNLVQTMTEMSNHLHSKSDEGSGCDMFYPSGIRTIDISDVNKFFGSMSLDTLAESIPKQTSGNIGPNPIGKVQAKDSPENNCSVDTGSDLCLQSTCMDNNSCLKVKVSTTNTKTESVKKCKISVIMQPTEVYDLHSEKISATLNKSTPRQFVADSDPSLSNTALNIKMMDRKSKQLNKRSKNRRRRQRRKNGVNCKNEDQIDCANKVNLNQHQKPLEIRTESVPSSPKSQKPISDSNCDIFCDIVNITGKDNGIEIGVSSFFISVDSTGDEDSDWDTCDKEWSNADLSEFEFNGLFVANFGKSTSVAVEISSSPPSAETQKIRCFLQSVNKKWKNVMKDVDGNPKIPTKVTFASEDKVCPVDVYDRKGEWEVYALERCRFQRRIADLDKIISPCLSQQHRTRVLQRLHVPSET